MRSLALSSSLALLAVIGSARAEDGPKALFNGKDLTGWTAVFDAKDVDPAQTWSVSGGTLKCTGKPVGYIRTDRDDYENYRLVVEYRWPAEAKGGNNGVLIHSTTPNALGVWPKSVEVQLMAGNAGDFWTIGTDLDVPNEEARKQGRRHVNLTDGSEKPFGEWNTMEITAKGDTVAVKVNGTLVNEANHLTATKGAISLQSEGAPIEFRKVELTPLAP
jgi:hypothetical protein